MIKVVLVIGFLIAYVVVQLAVVRYNKPPDFRSR